MSSQNRGALFFAGLVIGGLVGTGLALLLTPQSGEETRGQIRAKSVELKDGAVEGLAEAGWASSTTRPGRTDYNAPSPEIKTH